MRWCNVQTNEHDQQAKMFPTICTHHKLHNDNNENKIPVFPECICNVTKYDVTNISDTQPQKNYWYGWYFRFDIDNNRSYGYILSITETQIGQLNTYNPIYDIDNDR